MVEQSCVRERSYLPGRRESYGCGVRIGLTLGGGVPRKAGPIVGVAVAPGAGVLESAGPIVGVAVGAGPTLGGGVGVAGGGSVDWPEGIATGVSRR